MFCKYYWSIFNTLRLHQIEIKNRFQHLYAAIPRLRSSRFSHIVSQSQSLYRAMCPTLPRIMAQMASSFDADDVTFCVVFRQILPWILQSSGYQRIANF